MICPTCRDLGFTGAGGGWTVCPDCPPATVHGPSLHWSCYECDAIFIAHDADNYYGNGPRCPMCGSGELDPAPPPASHSDQAIDNHNAADDCTCHSSFGPCVPCQERTRDAMCDREHHALLRDTGFCHWCGEAKPAQVVTPAGVQYLLPGESPPPARKGADTDQTRMF